MSFEQKDLELIEHMLYKNSDDISIAIGRSFERLEDRMDNIESRTYTRLADIEEKIEDTRQSLMDILEIVREDLREMSKIGLD
jgi:hypothetical protein